MEKHTVWDLITFLCVTFQWKKIIRFQFFKICFEYENVNFYINTGSTVFFL